MPIDVTLKPKISAVFVWSLTGSVDTTALNLKYYRDCSSNDSERKTQHWNIHQMGSIQKQVNLL